MNKVITSVGVYCQKCLEIIPSGEIITIVDGLSYCECCMEDIEEGRR